jgi:hypothetical protein
MGVVKLTVPVYVFIEKVAEALKLVFGAVNMYRWKRVLSPQQLR